jgi:hypothetical protein
MKPVRDRRLLKTVISGGILAIISILTMGLGASSAPVIASGAKPGCVIKGNISVATGKKLYHLPGMRNYEATVIELTKGERWFCSEAEALSNGWIKAPR